MDNKVRPPSPKQKQNKQTEKKNRTDRIERGSTDIMTSHLEIRACAADGVAAAVCGNLVYFRVC